MTIGIIDFGIGNINSVQKALNALHIPSLVSQEMEELVTADKYILPGVGSFAAASEALSVSGRRTMLQQLTREKPLLGICVGMQILATLGEEHGENPGLDVIPGLVSRMPTHLPLPHVGWNNVDHTGKSPLFTDIPSGSCFYFTHSFVFANRHPEHCLATSEYGIDFTCAVNYGRFWGVQFHPEKSQQFGLRLLKNFVELCC